MLSIRFVWIKEHTVTLQSGMDTPCFVCVCSRSHRKQDLPRPSSFHT